ncbi:hypothetical protein M231_03593 [Tremella mesenterica]|uniref:Tyr recombinase domain-containing protein n=1 Tax=Tremella mesenterica TaxID=5217 RepID=A0A4Q1BMM5_TREME|nr:hypothetical protein M231_03593 [Tremella mesenterica]
MAYDKVVESYARFGRVQGWTGPLFPAKAERVSVWIAHEAHRLTREGKQLFKKTLETKVYALLSWHKDLGYTTDGVVSPRVQRVITGANRFHGVNVKPQPLPITLPILRAVVKEIRENVGLYGGVSTALALVACYTVGFACFMRMGELTYTSFDHQFDLSRSAITIDDHGNPSLLRLSASKTDPFRIGISIPIPKGPTDICPVRHLRRWMIATRSRPHDPPLLTLGNDLNFPKSKVVNYLTKALTNAGYPGHKFSGHSLRRGAATWAASVGMSATQIQTLGRWSSDAYKLYVDAGPRSHLEAGRRLLFSTSEDSSLDPSGIPRPAQVWRPAI